MSKPSAPSIPPVAGVPVLLLAALSVAVSQTIVVAALPVFSRTDGVSATTATWLLTIFMLASAVMTPIAGRLGDLHGHRRVMVAGLLLLGTGSVVAAIGDLTGWFPGLLLGRVLQGCSGGVFPAVFGLARGSLSPRRLHGVVAALSATFGIGGALGMVVAGPLVDLVGTSWLFWISLLMAGACLAGTPLLTEDSHRRSSGEHDRLDVGGAVLLATTLVALLLGISQGRTWGWVSPATVTAFATAVVLGVIFVLAEARATAPMIDLGLLVRPALAGTNLATVVISIGMFAAVTLIPRFAQATSGYGFGYTPTQTGLMLVPTAALMVVAAPAATRLSRATSSRTTFQIGALLACLALVVFALANAHAWEFYLGGAVLGIAYGLAFASLGGLVVGAVSHEQTGAATGINTILRTLGGALGAQLAAVILVGSAGADQVPTRGGYVLAFLVSAAVALVALATAAAIGHHPLATASSPSATPVPGSSTGDGVDG
ncbi:MAG: MFS transporter [Nocardioides sp.]|uniref:MFS transporter n=1 Tax=Nocardioides sp. TaxID=35761 RepID=UPI0039E2EAA9